MTRAPWTILSSRAATASGLCRPSAFGMYVRRDGCGGKGATTCWTASCLLIPANEERIPRLMMVAAAGVLLGSTTALLAVLLIMGIEAAFFGPLKYAILAAQSGARVPGQ